MSYRRSTEERRRRPYRRHDDGGDWDHLRRILLALLAALTIRYWMPPFLSLCGIGGRIMGEQMAAAIRSAHPEIDRPSRPPKR